MKRKSAIVGDGEGDEDGCVLPDDIVEDILSRLHSKILMKIRTVCKKWKTLISTCYFKRLHNEKSLKNPSLIFLPDSSSNTYVLTTATLTGDVLDRWDLSLPSCQSLHLMFSQWGPNNLIYFIFRGKRNKGNSFVVCNPSVRKIIYLPQQPHPKTVAAYGFCYLPSMNQYVIISVTGCNKWQMITFSTSNNFKDLHTRGWKPIKNNTGVKASIYGVFVNGVLFWTGVTHSQSGCLLGFDLYEEKFFNVVYPDEIKGTYHKLFDFNGDLHLLPWLDRRPKTLWTFWKLDDVRNHTWIKQYTINVPDSCLKPLMVREDGEMLVYHEEFLEWFSHETNGALVLSQGMILPPLNPTLERYVDLLLLFFGRKQAAIATDVLQQP